MKKILKLILAVFLVGTIGYSGFVLGENAPKQNQANDDKDTKFLEKYNYLKEVIDENYLFDYDKKDLDQGAYKGLFQNLNDPYTVYYTKDEFKKLIEQTSGEYAGVGIQISNSPEGLIKIINVFKSSPAEKADLKPGDFIIKVNDKEYTGAEIDKAVSAMKGEENTKVKLTILRQNDNDKQELDKEVTRKKIKIETVKSKMIDPDNKIGYLAIKEFDESTTDDFFNQLDKLEEEGAKSLVLDLRNNPGGLLDTCLKIADRFLDEGDIVFTKDKNGKEVVEKSDAKKDDIKLVVLINENSASASEILSGALKDRKRAKIVGKTSFGKGIVQKIFPIGDDGSGVKITVSEYFTPSKVQIHKKGVTPDIEIESDIKANEIGEKDEDDNQLQEALKVLKEEK